MNILHSSFLFALVGFLPVFTIGADLDIGKFTTQHVCKATISIVMGKNPTIMKTDRIDDNIVYVSYVRPDDGKHWAYRCKLENSNVIWGSDTGRWRTHSSDSKITFSVSGNNLDISEIYSDGSTKQESFTLQQLAE